MRYLSGDDNVPGVESPAGFGVRQSSGAFSSDDPGVMLGRRCSEIAAAKGQSSRGLPQSKMLSRERVCKVSIGILAGLLCVAWVNPTDAQGVVKPLIPKGLPVLEWVQSDSEGHTNAVSGMIFD